MAPTTYPASSKGHETSRLGAPEPRVMLTSPSRSRVAPGKSASSESLTGCSYPETVVNPAKRRARESTDCADREAHDPKSRMRAPDRALCITDPPAGRRDRATPV